MFGNTVLSFEDNKSLEDVCIIQEKYDSDYFTSCLPFPECEDK